MSLYIRTQDQTPQPLPTRFESISLPNQPAQEQIRIREASLFPQGIPGYDGLDFEIVDVTAGTATSKEVDYTRLWSEGVTAAYVKNEWIGPDQRVEFPEGDRGYILYAKMNGTPFLAIGGVRDLKGRLITPKAELPKFTPPLFVGNFDLERMQGEHISNGISLPNGTVILSPGQMRDELVRQGARQPQVSELAKLFHAPMALHQALKDMGIPINRRTLVDILEHTKDVVLANLASAFANVDLVAYIRASSAGDMFSRLAVNREVIASPVNAQVISNTVRAAMPGYFFEKDGVTPRDITMLYSPKNS